MRFHFFYRDYGKLKNKIIMEVTTSETETCNYCDKTKENRLLAFGVFSSMLLVGVIYVVYQRCKLKIIKRRLSNKQHI